MLLTYQAPAHITSLLLSLALSSTASEISSGAITRDQCIGLNNTNFNATGSVKSESLWLAGNNSDWTWHTGLLANGDQDQATQYFWVDTTGSFDLNSRNLPFRTCMQFFSNLPEELWNKTQNVTGNCEDTIGTDCLNALRAAVPVTPSCPLDFGDYPRECGHLNLGGALGFQLTHDPTNTTDNKTCNATFDNAKGDKSAFLVTKAGSDQSGSFADYDLMSKKGYMMMLQSFQPQVAVSVINTKFICMRNTDVAEGSRNSLPKQPSPSAQPQPSAQPKPSDKPGASARNAASMGDLVSTMMVALMLLI